MWEDASAIFDDLYGWLESVYKSDFKRFFTDRLRVKSSPDTEEFAKAWLTLQDRRNIESQRVEVILDRIYSRLILFLPNRGNANWWEGFKNSAKIWTSRSKSRISEFKKTNSVFVADDRDLQNLFSNDLSFAWKPERFTYNDIIPFFKELSLQLLSYSVQIELIQPNEKTNPTDYKLLTQFSKKLLCYLLCNESKEIYERRFEEGMLPDLLKGQEVLVSNLTIEYRVSEIRKEKDKNSFWDKKSHILYLKSDIDDAELLEDVAGSLARIIWGRNFRSHHEDSVQKILGIKDEERFNRILNKKNWHIPPEEEKRIEDILLQDIQPHAYPEPPLDAESGTSTTDDEKDQAQQDSGNENDQAQQDSGNENDQAQQDSGNENDQTQRDSGNENDQTQRDPGNENDQTQRDPDSATRQRTSENDQTQRDPDSATKGKPRNQRIRTYVYVEPNSKKSEEQDKKSPDEHELKVESEARKHVCAYEKEEGRVPRQMDQTNPGYDIISRNPKDNNKRYIEVKGISGEWNMTGVGLSNRQFRENIQYKQNYWLYIVEYALDPNNYHIYCIQNPVFTVNYFMFDSYWKILDLYQNETADPTNDFICGAKIHCGPVLGIGLITDVSIRGDSKILKVKFTDDNELWLPLNVRYMYLVEQADG